jgi:photosystem II stability/assembly factor-like uncharacterized protein
MRALATTALGTVLVDLASGDSELVDDDVPAGEPVDVSLPLLVAADRVGSRIVAVVGRRPPLVISDDAGTTWREAGGGLPPGRAVAISPDQPDHIVFATDSRLYVSEDGGRFWRVLAPELIDVAAVAWASPA